ncbi:MAG: hypothetical protein CMI32_02670, partial [Opitutales bacterium]|nr:hypothetical protein [Opitutales bacterium]
MKRGLTALLPIAIWLSAPLWSFAANSPWEANLLSNEIRLQLDEGIKVTAKRISGVDLGAGNFSWTGEVTGKVPGYVTLSFVYDSLSGSVNFPGKGCYELSKGSSGELVATQLVGGTSLPCGACSDRKAGSWKDPRRIRRSRTWRNGDGNVIDLLVVYTAGAMAMEGSGAADDVAAKVATAVADTNLCFRNSRVDVSLRL